MKTKHIPVSDLPNCEGSAKALEIEGQRPPEPRTKLPIGGASAAEVTSAAYSPALGKVVALGYVRVEHAEPGTEMAAGELRARVR